MDKYIDNVEFAILTKLNTLSDRYGLRPYDLVATLHSNQEVCGYALRFEIPNETGGPERAKARKFLTALGVDDNTVLNGGVGFLGGGPVAVIDAIDNALRRAPKRRQL
jgi:hypothetical protein